MPIGNAFAIIKSVKLKVPMVEEYVNVGGFENPTGLAFDSNENLFVVCSGSYINKIDPNGNLTTFVQLITGGEPINSNFITIDNSDNIYTTDTSTAAPGLLKYHENIYKINSSKVISTYIKGFGPSIGICMDQNMNLYITQYFGSLHKYDSNLNKTSNFGNVITSGKVGGIAIDSNNDIYFSDYGSHLIYKVTKNGIKSTYAGVKGVSGHLDDISTNAKFSAPYGLCFDEFDNLYVSETGNNIIRKITPNGIVSTIAGNKVIGDKVGVASQANFNFPYGLAYKNNIIYISDSKNKKIKKLIL